jgi:hypothetical protein
LIPHCVRQPADHSHETETRINLLAIRRVQLRIDRELKKTTDNSTP